MSVSDKAPREPNKLTIAKRISTSFEGEQEALSICLLMRHGVNFTLLKPRKTHIGTENDPEAIFFTIETIHVGGHAISFQGIVEKIVMIENKKISEEKKGRSKYEKRNVISATNNFLSNLLSKLDYSVTFKKTRSTNIIVKMNRVSSLTGNGIEFSTNSSISEQGKIVNRRIRDIFDRADIKREQPIIFTHESIEQYLGSSQPAPDEFIQYIVNFISSEKTISSINRMGESADEKSSDVSTNRSTAEPLSRITSTPHKLEETSPSKNTLFQQTVKNERVEEHISPPNFAFTYLEPSNSFYTCEYPIIVQPPVKSEDNEENGFINDSYLSNYNQPYYLLFTVPNQLPTLSTAGLI